MQITLTDRFQRDLLALPADRFAGVSRVIPQLPLAFRDPHRHRGIGLRKLHHRGFYEIRCGLDLRVIVELIGDAVFLHRVGSHDDVQRYLHTL